MDANNVRQVTPRLRAEDDGMNGKAYFDPEDFAPGYIRRGVGRLPRQSDAGPWVNSQDYYTEKDILPMAELDDDVLQYTNPGKATKVA
jgi:hypothetical protein